MHAMHTVWLVIVNDPRELEKNALCWGSTELSTNVNQDKWIDDTD